MKIYRTAKRKLFRHFGRFTAFHAAKQISWPAPLDAERLKAVSYTPEIRMGRVVSAKTGNVFDYEKMFQKPRTATKPFLRKYLLKLPIHFGFRGSEGIGDAF